MQTTLDLDDDLLQAAELLARQQGKTAGQVISDLVRQALRPTKYTNLRNGVPVFEPVPGAPPATLELVNSLRDDE